MSRKRFSAAAQALFGGDGMVDVDPDANPLDVLERVVRRFQEVVGDKEARRILLDSLPARERRVFVALLARPPGRPGRPKGTGKWNRADDFFLALLADDVAAIRNEHPKWPTTLVCRELRKPLFLKQGGKRININLLYTGIAEKTLYGLLTKRHKK